MIALGKISRNIARQPKCCLSISMSKNTLCVISGTGSIFSSTTYIRKGKGLSVKMEIISWKNLQMTLCWNYKVLQRKRV